WLENTGAGHLPMALCWSRALWVREKPHFWLESFAILLKQVAEMYPPMDEHHLSKTQFSYFLP
ncbi:MAG: hypothetical protein ACRCWR_11790, partial [Saezia sp.]